MADLSKIYLFRITHIENIPHILQHGITHINSPNCNPDYKPIGDSGLISKRNEYTSPDGTCLGDYIPFYFGIRMPMLYVIQNGFNGVTKISAKNIVYCVSSVEQIVKHDLNFMFTDGHAVDWLSTFYNKNDIENIDNIIDKKAINSKYWTPDNDLDLKRRKEAEFLVKDDVQYSAILGFMVANEESRNQLLELGVEKKIVVKPEYYF
jgi:hypothetical protein